MPVLVFAGAWRGYCVNQCPIFAQFAVATPSFDLRFLDRHAQPDIAAHLAVCGGQRVPVAAFFSEDLSLMPFYGDKTRAAPRAAASAQLGASGAARPPADQIAAVVSDWLGQFERVHSDPAALRTPARGARRLNR